MKDTVIFRYHRFHVILAASVKNPRPHLIMLYTGKRSSYHSIYDFDPILFNVWIKTIKKTFTQLPQCIFSVHLGHYQSKDSPHFHAHYYLPMKQYMEMVTKHQIDIDFLINLEKWPDRVKQEGRRYKQHDLRLISNLTPKQLKVQPFPKLSRNFSIRFHKTQPRIGFHFNQSGPRHDQLSDLILVMMEFIKYYQLNNRKKGGCHLCLQNNLFIDHEFNDIIGYLQVDLVNYYRINPDRHNWLERFKHSTYQVFT